MGTDPSSRMLRSVTLFPAPARLRRGRGAYARPLYGALTRFFYALALVLALGPAPGAAAEPIRIAILGDSIAAGFGLAPRDTLDSQLALALGQAGHNVRVINAGRDGDTTAGGLARLDWMLADRPHIVIVELGGNDGLRGIDPAAMEANLDAIVARLKRENVRVLVAGMLAPPNLGPEYGRAFNAVFPRVAARHGVAFYPFILDGVAADPALNQPDGIHPNARGVRVIVERLMPHLERLLPPPGQG